jgi:hypothetical protein
MHHSSWRAVLVAVSAGACLALVAVVAPQGTAARRAALRACTQDTSPIATTHARRVGRDVVGTTALGNWATASCALHEHLTFAVKAWADRMSSQGTITSIAGNGATKTVDTPFRPGGVLVYSWRWQNWCGAQGRFALQATWDGEVYSRSPSQGVKAPACVSRNGRSSLAAVRPSIPTCSASDYQATTDLGQPIEERLVDFVQLSPPAGRPPCLLKKVRIQFAVQGRSGGKWTTLSPVTGNPATRTIGGMLTPNYGAYFVFWAWWNWCGGGDAFRASVQVSGGSVFGPPQSQGPQCQDAGSASTLTPSYGHVG